MKECLKENRFLLAATVLFSVFTSAISTFVALFLQRIVDVALAKDLPGFWQLVIAAGIYLAAYGLFFLLYSLFSKVFLRNLTKQLRSRVFAGVMRQGYADFTGTNSADYLSALTNDIKLVEENYLLPLLQTLQYAVMALVTLVLLFALSPLVTGCLLVCMLLTYLIPSLMGKALQSRQDAQSSRLSSFTAKLKDIFSGYEVIRSYQMNGPVSKRFEAENSQLAKAKFKADRLFAINESLSGVLSSLTLMVTVFLSAFLVIQGSITMGTTVALVQLGSSFVMPIMMIMQGMPKITGIRPVIKRLDTLANYQDQTFTGREEPVFQKELKAQGVRFAYEEHPVLNGVDVTIEHGKKYAVVGGSGCGKTTLIRLFTGCYGGYEGTVCLDGKELHDLDIHKVQRMLSVIHQNIYMFDATVRDNICLYRKFAPEELEVALQRSGVDQFLPELAQGLDTPVGENGSNLSGGQRQRIAIARALIQKTPLLILDEGTSAIDMQTAYDIESSLLSLPELTLITITHKMSEELLGKYDSILFMENGKVAQAGNLKTLLAQKGPFSQFFFLREEGETER